MMHRHAVQINYNQICEHKKHRQVNKDLLRLELQHDALNGSSLLWIKYHHYSNHKLQNKLKN